MDVLCVASDSKVILIIWLHTHSGNCSASSEHGTYFYRRRYPRSPTSAFELSLVLCKLIQPAKRQPNIRTTPRATALHDRSALRDPGGSSNPRVGCRNSVGPRHRDVTQRCPNVDVPGARRRAAQGDRPLHATACHSAKPISRHTSGRRRRSRATCEFPCTTRRAARVDQKPTDLRSTAAVCAQHRATATVSSPSPEECRVGQQSGCGNPAKLPDKVMLGVWLSRK